MSPDPWVIALHLKSYPSRLLKIVDHLRESQSVKGLRSKLSPKELSKPILIAATTPLNVQGGGVASYAKPSTLNRPQP